jgi:hypothetical protein
MCFGIRVVDGGNVVRVDAALQQIQRVLTDPRQRLQLLSCGATLCSKPGGGGVPVTAPIVGLRLGNGEPTAKASKTAMRLCGLMTRCATKGRVV